MNNHPEINPKDAILYVDITCYRCHRLVAFSNTTEFDGRRYCPRCRGMSPVGEIEQ